MVAVIGTYQNGYVKLDKEYSTKDPVKVIVTFLEEVEEKDGTRISLADFSFSKSQKNLAHVKGSFGDAIAEERRSAV